MPPDHVELGPFTGLPLGRLNIRRLGAQVPVTYWQYKIEKPLVGYYHDRKHSWLEIIKTEKLLVRSDDHKSSGWKLLRLAQPLLRTYYDPKS